MLQNTDWLKPARTILNLTHRSVHGRTQPVHVAEESAGEEQCRRSPVNVEEQPTEGKERKIISFDHKRSIDIPPPPNKKFFYIS